MFEPELGDVRIGKANLDLLLLFLLPPLGDEDSRVEGSVADSSRLNLNLS